MYKHLFIILCISFLFSCVFIPSIRAQSEDPFENLVDQLLGGEGGDFDNDLFSEDVRTDCGFPEANIDYRDLEVELLEDDRIVFTLPEHRQDGDVVQRYSVSVLPVASSDLNEYIESNDFDYSLLDNLEEQIVSPSIANGRMRFSMDVIDSNDDQYITIYPLYQDGNQKCEGLEDMRVRDTDAPSNPSSEAEEAADCLDDNCEIVIDSVACRVNEETLEVDLQWDVTDSVVDEVEVLMKEHTDSQYESQGRQDASDETFSTELPQRTSYLFLLKPLNNDGFRVGTEVNYLCKFAQDPVSYDPGCVGEDCIGETPDTGPEIVVGGVFVIALLGYGLLRRRRKY